MGENLPMLLCIGIAAVWVVCIFMQMSSLYRKGSPLNIVYWGSWICFTLWYSKYVKEVGGGWNAAIAIIVTVALGLGLILSLFGSKDVRKGIEVKRK